MRSLVLALILAGAAASPALSETWRDLGPDDQGTLVSVERDTISTDGNLRIVRTRWLFKSDDPEGRRQLIATERYDCTRRVLSTREMLMTMKDGRVDRQAWDTDQWDDVLDDTTAEVVLDFVCAL